MALPNLADLKIFVADQLKNDSGNGVYCLDPNPPCESKIRIVRNATQISPADYQELQQFMASPLVETTYTIPWGKRIHRKQCTFGAVYPFAGQEPTSFSASQTWPKAVTDVLQFIKECAKNLAHDPKLYNGVHVNLYEDSIAGVDAHDDKEDAMVIGLPIFSITFLEDKARGPRPFRIYEKPGADVMHEFESAKAERTKQVKELNKRRNAVAKGLGETIKRVKGEPLQDYRYRLRRYLAEDDPPEIKKPPLKFVHEVILNDGDLLVMEGNMQQYYEHEIPKNQTKRGLISTSRLNLTCRAFNPDAIQEAENRAKERPPLLYSPVEEPSSSRDAK